jgi:signal transduction histidine kinase
MTEQYETKLHNENEKFMNNMSSSLHEISSSAGMLSNFSHINKLYKEEVILSSFINEFLKQYINHPLYDRIEFSPFTLSDSSSEESYRSVKDPNVRIDKALFTIALKNLINNALEAIDSKGYVKIKLNNNKAMITMEIKNSLHSKGASIQVETCMGIGYSTKETGSGLGIPISKSIIEKHGGTLEIETQENEFVVRIMLATN